jgi:hypothetical protein
MFLVLPLIAAAEAPASDAAARMEEVGEFLDALAPEGWTQADPTERYTVANVYDKINGRSELHMSYGLVGLAWAGYENAADPEQYVEVYLYDMGTVPGGFGVFSMERPQEKAPIDLGREGYRSGNDVSFWKGRYYANLVVWEEGEALHRAQETIAKTLADRLEDSGDPLWGVELLPKEGLHADSVQYFMVDALSLSFLTDTYTGTYKVGEKEVKVFLSRQADEHAAKVALADFTEYLARYGDSVKASLLADTLWVQGDTGGGYVEGALRLGRYLLGVTGAEGAALAQAAVEQVQKGLAAKLP